nr:hypothetical protein [Tanacetum cinerariifolium]GEZ22975.1 hypothetical protein [Tanacetum cinerariifolium]GEZ33240.1 hypothetical protein [Tanacetum cinerariifolium]
FDQLAAMADTFIWVKVTCILVRYYEFVFAAIAGCCFFVRFSDFFLIEKWVSGYSCLSGESRICVCNHGGSDSSLFTRVSAQNHDFMFATMADQIPLYSMVIQWLREDKMEVRDG